MGKCTLTLYLYIIDTDDCMTIIIIILNLHVCTVYATCTFSAVEVICGGSTS